MPKLGAVSTNGAPERKYNAFASSLPRRRNVREPGARALMRASASFANEVPSTAKLPTSPGVGW
jgi:hypothetical protein